MKNDLKNAEAILSISQEKETDDFHSCDSHNEKENNVIALGQEEKNEKFSINFLKINEEIKNGLKAKESSVYKEIIEKNEVLHQKYQSEPQENEEEKQGFLNQMLFNINDLILYCQMHDNSNMDISELLNNKCFLVKEMFFFESKKKSRDLQKSLVLINTLLHLKKSIPNETEQKKLEIIEILKQRGIFFIFFL